MVFNTKKIVKILVLNVLLCIVGGLHVYASECGVAHFLENKSSGVQVTSNACNSDGEMALGSIVNITPGGRLWLKSPPRSSADKHFQTICQNLSPEAIAVGVDSAEAPWVVAKGLKNCSAWVDNKMSCNNSSDGSKALYCVLAEVVAVGGLSSSSAAERTTSVTMRAIGSVKPAEIAAEFEKEQVLAALKPEAGLCRNLYQPSSELRVDWIVGADGLVISAIPTPKSGGADIVNEANKHYIDCILAVIRDYPYPKPARTTMLSADF